jgi:hypothetical protein
MLNSETIKDATSELFAKGFSPEFMEQNREVVMNIALTARKLNEETLPLYARFCSKVETNPYVDALKLARDTAVTGGVIYGVYQAGKWVWNYFRT